jgi:hypothetical protein
MENTENASELLDDNEIVTKKKSTIGIHIFYIVLILLLIGGMSYLFKQNKQVTETLHICDTSKNNLSVEREQMIHSLDSMAEQLKLAKTSNGELSEDIKAKLAEISALKGRINSQRVNLDSLSTYKREIESVRKVTIHYLTQIDSLNRSNLQLIDKNKELSTKVDEQLKVDVEKTKQLEDLSTKVEKASVMKAGGIACIGINSKSKPVTKAKKVVKVKTSFTIMENSVIDAGQKMVYLRIIRADGACLTADETNTFKYENATIIYTEKTEVDYQNKDLDVTIYYNATDDITPGTYTIQLFCDGKTIGQSQLTFDK